MTVPSDLRPGLQAMPAAGGTVYVSSVVTTAQSLGGGERFPASPNQPFALVHNRGHNGSWNLEIEGLKRPMWLPSLAPVILAPGANGVGGAAGDGGARITDGFLLRMAKRGAEVVREQFIWRGEPGYLRAIPCEEPRTHTRGMFYHTRFERLRPPVTMEGVGDAVLERALWNQWRVALVTEGLVSEPDQRTIEQHIDELQSKLESRRTERGGGDTTEWVRLAAERYDRALAAVVPRRGESADQHYETGAPEAGAVATTKRSRGAG